MLATEAAEKHGVIESCLAGRKEHAGNLCEPELLQAKSNAGFKRPVGANLFA